MQTPTGACQGERREEERDTARKPGHTEGTSREGGGRARLLIALSLSWLGTGHPETFPDA